MEIIQSEQSGIHIISITGRLDADTSEDAEEKLDTFLKEHKNRLLIDLSDLEYISSAGLRVLLWLSKGVKETDGKIVLCCLNAVIKEIIEISGFDAVIPIRESIEDGLREIEK